MQEGINRDTPGLDARTRSSVVGKIIAVAARQDKVIESSNAE
jgi:hypothetical protein